MFWRQPVQIMTFSVQSYITPLTRGRFKEEPDWEGGNKNNNFPEHAQIQKLYMFSSAAC